MFGILFDFDGTLINSEKMHQQSINKLLEKYDWPKKYAPIFMGRRPTDVFSQVDGPWKGMDYEALVAELYHAIYLSEIEPVPGAAKFLLWIKAEKIPVGLVTSGTQKWVETGIKAAGLPIDSSYFDVLMTSERQTQGKPAPDGYLAAAKELSLQPQQCCIFEDSPVGVTAARSANAGMVVGLTTSQPASKLITAGADLLLPDLRQATEIIDAWRKN